MIYGYTVRSARDWGSLWEVCVITLTILPDRHGQWWRYRPLTRAVRCGAVLCMQVREWVASLESMPWHDGAAAACWSLMNIYPRSVLAPEALLSEVAAGASQIALFVEMAA